MNDAARPTPDEVSFARLYDETSARVYGLVLRVVRDPALAEQVTRDVYLHAWAQTGRDERSTATVSSLMTTAHRRAVDAARASAVVECEVVEDRPAEGRTAGSERAHAALDRLPAAEREAVELAYFDGYTHTEVALLAGHQPGGAQALIRDGLRLLLAPA